MVYVLAHKLPPYGLINDGWHIPLQVGADLSEENVCELKDNIGINISKYNPFFCETTGYLPDPHRGGVAERLYTLYVMHNFNNIFEVELKTLGESV